MSETLKGWRERLTGRSGLVARRDLQAILSLLWPVCNGELGAPEQSAADGDTVGGNVDGALPPTESGGAGAWHETKVIHGRPYLYERWRDGKRKRSRYVGKAGGA